MVKSTLKRFGSIKPSSGLHDGEKLLLEQRWSPVILIKHQSPPDSLGIGINQLNYRKQNLTLATDFQGYIGIVIVVGNGHDDTSSNPGRD